MPIDGWVNDIHCGDAEATLGEMPESSVHMALTSPPFWGLRDYGVDGQIGLEPTLAEYVDSIMSVGQALRRVLRDDGVWWLNLGDTFAGGGGITGKPDDWDDLHDDENYPDDPPARTADFPRKTKLLVPHRVAIALQDDGWIVRGDGVWEKINPMPHPVKDRFVEVKEYLFHLTPKPDYWWDLDAVREPHKESSLKRIEYGYGGSKLLDTDRHPNREKESSVHNFEEPLHPDGKNPGDVFQFKVRPYPEAHFAVYPTDLCTPLIKSSCPPRVCADCGTPYDRVIEEKNRRVAGGSPAVELEETGYKDRTGNHQGRRDFTLPEREFHGWEATCECEAETEAGIVLDPFAGAGTTCLAAKELGRRFIGIDLKPEYVAMAQKRIGIDVADPEVLLDDDEQAPLTEFT